MAPSYDTYDNLIRNISGREFTLSEALDIQDVLDTMPTGRLNLGWVSAKTGSKVIIGRGGGIEKFVPGKNKKKEKIINPFLQVNKQQQLDTLSRMHSKRFR